MKTKTIPAKIEHLPIYVQDFKPGLYRHYKGGLYSALQLVTHHETRLPMVLYVSLEKGSVNVRPLVGWHLATPQPDSDIPVQDVDGWCDAIEIENEGLAGGSSKVDRFSYIGPATTGQSAEWMAARAVGQEKR